MRRSRAGLAIVVVAAIATMLCAPRRRDDRVSPQDGAALERRTAYCGLVAAELEQDATVFEHGSHEEREAAFVRFEEQSGLHRSYDLWLCAPIVVDYRDVDCSWSDKWSCRAQEARLARASISPESVTTAEALHRLRDFCDIVRIRAAQAASAFEGREPARLRWNGPWAQLVATASTPEEMALCSPWPPDLTDVPACRSRGDYECLARVARDVEASVYVPDEPGD